MRLSAQIALPATAWHLLLVLLVAGGDAPLAHAGDAATPTFEAHVRPILRAHCFHCHGEGDKLEGKLDLRLRRLIVHGGESGPAVVPGQVDASLLLKRIRDGEMPPKGKLSQGEVTAIERWIEAGAPTAGPEPENAAALSDVTESDRAYWAFQPVRRPALPAVRDGARLRTPIDAFILERLENAGASFSADAERSSWLRRASFSLRGLPPTIDETAEFLADAGPDAESRLVDRWLASPHYGERWGRHWLDTAGYADSDGYTETDPVRPYAYKYRDWVIRAWNHDLPYDQFVVEQLAGDELTPLPYAEMSPDKIDRLVATGFLRTVPDGSSSGVAAKEAGNAVMAETVKVVSTSLLGLTIGCAQCHNHRYDPIPISDYYRMRAIFEPALNWRDWRAPRQRLISLYTDADRAAAAKIESAAQVQEAARQLKQTEYILRTLDLELAKIPQPKADAVRAARDTPPDKRTSEQTQLLKEFPSVNVDAGSLYLYDAAAANDLKSQAEKIAALRATKPAEDFVSCLTEPTGTIPETRVYDRGDPDAPKQPVTPGELTVLTDGATAAIPVDDPNLPTSGRRLAYARHLTSGRHPLVARVLVNRVWMHQFGRGIVATAGDFGSLGQRPTHPELLDWLADRFVASEGPIGGWSIKRLQRELMLSTTYRQSSQRNSQSESDPDNLLLGRMSVRRLEAEVVRDAILSASGALNRKQFGPAVPVMEDDVGQIVIGIENKNGENRPGPIIPMHGEDFRRSVFVQSRRTRPLGVLDTFDLPTLEPNCTGRASSTVTSQSLLLMNSDFILEQAQQMADRLARETDAASGEPAQPPSADVLAAQVRLAWQLVFGRAPSDAEQAGALRYLERQRERFAAQPADAKGASKQPPSAAAIDRSARAALCQALFSANEFLYVD